MKKGVNIILHISAPKFNRCTINKLAKAKNFFTSYEQLLLLIIEINPGAGTELK